MTAIYSGAALLFFGLILRAFALQAAIALVRAWTWIYTLAVRPEHRQRRRAEIASDLFEHVASARANGSQRDEIALHIALRWLIGVPFDCSWALSPGRASSAITRWWPIGLALILTSLALVYRPALQLGYPAIATSPLWLMSLREVHDRPAYAGYIASLYCGTLLTSLGARYLLGSSIPDQTFIPFTILGSIYILGKGPWYQVDRIGAVVSVTLALLYVALVGPTLALAIYSLSAVAPSLLLAVIANISVTRAIHGALRLRKVSAK